MPDEICGKTAKSTGEECQRPAGWGTDNDSGPCKFHGGASTGAPEGNNNATKTGAYADSFVQDFLTDDEIERVRKAEDILGEPESAQDLAEMVASVCLEQFRRTGDPRFLRRFESITDTFNIAPDDTQNLNVETDVPWTEALKQAQDERNG